MVTKKFFFLQMHNTILQRGKEFLNVKMINLEKIKKEKCQPPTHFKKTCPCTILPLLLFNFSDSPPLGEVIKIYSPPPLKRGGGVRNYAFGTIPQEPWQPGKGAKPDHMIHLNCREVCTYSSFKTTRTWENFNDRGTKMILLSGKPWLIANNSKSFALFGTFENIVTDVML